MDLDGVIAVVQKLWASFNSLTGVAILLGILVTQAVKVADKSILLKRDLDGRETVVVAAISTIFAFLFICVFVRVPVRTLETVSNALLAGTASPLIVWAAKKYLGVDLDKLLSGVDPEQKAV